MWTSISGGRQANDIVNWLKKKTGPPAKTLESKEDATEFITKPDVAIVGFFKARCSCSFKKYI